MSRWIHRMAWMYIQATHNATFALLIIVLLLLPGIVPTWFKSAGIMVSWYVGVLCFIGIWIVPGVFLNLGPEDLLMDEKEEEE